MPESLSIAAFVLGALLLLIALVPGGIELFGAKVPGMPGRLGRLIAFVLSIVFTVTGLSIDDGEHPGAARQEYLSHGSGSWSSGAQSGSTATPGPSTPHTGPAEPAAAAQIRLSWSYDPQAAQSLAGPHNVLPLILNTVATGTDIFALRITIENTGQVPVSVSPDRIRAQAGRTTLPSTTLEDPRFLRPTAIGPRQTIQGLLLVQAPLNPHITIAYDDPRIAVSYY